MTFTYMLDTNVLSALMADPHGSIAKHIERVGEQSICCSIIVAAELRYGAHKKGSRKLSQRVEAALSAISILPLTHPADMQYASLRSSLTTKGTPIGPNDLFIAAHALAEDLTLITANIREFKRVPDLRVESWGLA